MTQQLETQQDYQQAIERLQDPKRICPACHEDVKWIEIDTPDDMGGMVASAAGHLVEKLGIEFSAARLGEIKGLSFSDDTYQELQSQLKNTQAIKLAVQGLLAEQGKSLGSVPGK